MLRHEARAPRLGVRAHFSHVWQAARGGLAESIWSIVLIQALSAGVAVPAIGFLFERALAHAGLTNVTDHNLGMLLTDPVADLMLVAVLVVMLAAVLLQLAALFAISARQQRGRALTVRGMIHDTVRNLRVVLHPQAAVLFVYLLVLAPVTGLGLFSAVTHGIAIPPFVTREYLKSGLGTAIYVAASAAVVFVNARLIYTVPIMFLRRTPPLAAMRESVRMTARWRVLRVVIMVGLPAGLAWLMSSGLVELVVGVARLGHVAEIVLVSVATGVVKCVGLVLIAWATVTAINLCVADTLASSRTVPTHRLASAPALAPAAVHRSRAGRRWAALAVAAAVFTVATSTSVSTALASPAEPSDTIVIAHRGFSGGGVENTLSALDAAAAAHADAVEMDVQQTKDGVFVASHDTNLLMVAGRNENIYEMTADEVTSTVVREGGFHDTIPTMEQYVRHAVKLGMPLLIELKVTGHEHPGFVEDFLTVLDGLGVTADETYHSLDPEVVETLKTLRPHLRVGLTIAVSRGGVPDSPCDFYVIEQASYTTEFLQEAHRRGKAVYVWTVNDDDGLRRFLASRVDGIVTDHPDRALEFRSELSGTDAVAFTVEDTLGRLVP
ncbi:glycerophosphoryl diester phosphodiesterase membrane domain-containing protein [Microbacterium horticulturae]|uniref:Glycerophosphoryl diester phosphodiesterase membrane domain-containing protein n=1 Tax=Microbacterium horticulturae TaxID=3028316 RepID=A0ABY8BXY3_9MICO|nr:glycerophosphoryl diester phosphodiesterase membrane domain-containing protein [Microbacterium sp. KACC 23027]WEG09055.1 glycerophosphoryl diester phosphodiesterase membrane domain-containing protein [Microbacterium sp. KACC 23027]